MKQFKALFSLNLEDFKIYLAVLLLPFLVIHLFIFGVMAIVKPDTCPLICGMVLLMLLVVAAVIGSFSHIAVTFSQAVTFGRTRKKALVLALLVSAAQILCCTALALALTAVEQRFTVSLCSMFSGRPVYPEFNLWIPWWGFVLGAAFGLLLGVIGAAVINRFGRVGGWVLYGLFMFACFSPQILPWEEFTITNWLFPLLAVAGAAALIWSIFSLLRTSIK